MSQPNHYQPGQAVRLSVVITSLGSPIDPTSVAVGTKDPAGNIVAYTPTRDNAGLYHADFALPNLAAPGTWLVKWVTSGIPVNNAGVVFSSFVVDSPWF